MAYISKSILLFVMLVLFIIPVQSQVNLEWAACYNGPANNHDVAFAICIDDSGYVYVTGGSYESSSFLRPNYATIKYDQQGNEIWVRRYGDATVFQVGYGLTVDKQGYVYVTGASQTLKYDKDGNLVWVVTNQAVCRRIIFDDMGDIYLGGTLSSNYKLIKLTTKGEILWQQLYDGPANFRDNFKDMAIDSKGNVIVTGQSHGIGTHWDYATIKYSPEGDSLWVRRHNGLCSSFPGSGDYAYAVTVDDEDNVYVTGWSENENCNAQCFTIAYSSEGDILWEHRYPGVGYAGYDVLYSEGYVYVASRSSGVESMILKYDKQGNLVWTVSTQPYAMFVPNPPRLATDIEGYIYMTSLKVSSFVVLKVSPSGSAVWEYLYPGVSNPGCAVWDIAIDENKNIYLTGESIGWVCPGGDYDYLTIKISQDKVSIDPQSEIVTEFELFQNYPNPFNPVTIINYQLPIADYVSLKIYDMLGKEVAVLVDGDMSPERHSVSWDASGFASGVYYYRLTAGEFSQTRKLILLR